MTRSTTSRPGLGILLVVAMTLCFASMDTTSKYVGAFLPVLLIIWVRYLFQCVAMAVWIATRCIGVGRANSRCASAWSAGFRAAHPKFQVARGLLLLLTTVLGFYGVQQLPVGEFTAIAMLAPVAVTVLSAWVLHERVSPLRWLLVLGGFVGALIVIRPGSGLFGWAALLPLAGAITYAVFQLLTSKLTGLDDPFTTHFYTGLVGTVVLTPLLWLGPLDVTGTVAAASPSHLGLLLLIGALGTGGHLLLILALGLAPTAVLMPFVYLQIAAAMGVGYLVFGHIPDGWARVGMLVIGVCGAASVWLAMRQGPVPAPTVDTIAD